MSLYPQRLLHPQINLFVTKNVQIGLELLTLVTIVPSLHQWTHRCKYYGKFPESFNSDKLYSKIFGLSENCFEQTFSFWAPNTSSTIFSCLVLSKQKIKKDLNLKLSKTLSLTHTRMCTHSHALTHSLSLTCTHQIDETIETILPTSNPEI